MSLRAHILCTLLRLATSLLFSQSNPPAPPINPSTTHAPAEQPEVQSTYAKLPYASSPTEAKKPRPKNSQVKFLSRTGPIPSS